MSRGRLSVQPVEEEAYEAVRKLGEEGGWNELMEGGAKGKVGKGKAEEGEEAKPTPKRVTRGKAKAKVEEESEEEVIAKPATKRRAPVAEPKVKAEGEEGRPKRTRRS